MRVQNTQAAEALLALCRKLWSSEFVPPVYTLLLHQYLLSLPGNTESLPILINVLVDGAQALFWIDVSSNVVWCPLSTLTLTQSRVPVV